MTNALDKKVDKILDYLAVMTRENGERFEAIEKRFDAVHKRFDAVDEDMATLKGAVRRLEEQHMLTNKSLAILQDADRNRQDDIRQLNIRVGRLEDRIKRHPAPDAP